MASALISKIYGRLNGYLRRAAFELLDHSLHGLPGGTYFTRYPVTHYFSIEALDDPDLKRLAGGLDCLKVAADACYRAMGWQREASLEALVARGIEKHGHVEGVGWIHAKMAELAREQSIDSFCQEGLSVRQLCSKLLADRLVLASVGPGFRPGEKASRGGHFVVVFGFGWDGSACTGFQVFDLDRASAGETFVPVDVFRRSFSGRAVFLSTQPQTRQPNAQPLAWIEVDLEAVSHNIREIRRLVGPETAIAAVVKANAYGHGAAEVSRVLVDNGAAMLAVASLDEAVRLRRSGIVAPILVLYGVPVWETEKVVENGLETAVFDEDLPRALAATARKLGRNVRVHINVDTGMGWCGMSFEEPRILRLAKEVHHTPHLELAGIFSHFANSDGDPAYTQKQLTRFREVVGKIEQEGIHIPYKHISNSAGILRCPEARFNMVRPGLMIYGLSHAAGETRDVARLVPALQYKTRILQTRDLAAGEAVGYGSTYLVSRPTTIAILPVGYFDGIPRALSNKGFVLVKGRRAPVIGTICMNMVIVDVTGIPGVEKGDEAVLIGRQGEESVGAEQIAGIAGTISYEIVTRIPEHIPRIYPPSVPT